MTANEDEKKTKLIDRSVEDYRERLRMLIENIQAELNPLYILTKGELVIKLERILIRAKMFR